jgi:predicted cupin superfamily sugar epimerase
MTTWQELVERLEMQPHPEGGFFKESYRASGMIPAQARKKLGHKDARQFSTAIYYLLPAGATSKLHRMASDEIFHFYLGGPMTLVKLGPKGEVQTVVLGQDLAAGQQLQHVVRAGWWFGGWCEEGSPFSLVGCTVSPGFDFTDFKLGDDEALLGQYPSARPHIEKLRRSK